MATHDREYILNHIVPAVPSIREGSVWDLADPNATIVLTRCNRTANIELGNLARHRSTDPWRGVEATAIQGPTADNDNEALLPVQLGQRITILGAPIWIWSNMGMVAGEFAVPATTYNQRNHHHNRDHALLGLVPLSCLLTRAAPGTIFVRRRRRRATTDTQNTSYAVA